MRSAEEKARRAAYVRRWAAANPEYSKRYRAENRELLSQKNEAYRSLNKRAIKSKQYETRYGVNVTEVEAMIASQGNKCKICGEAKKLVVDHDHTTGIVRGMLCHGCNVGLGLLGDTTDGLLVAISYLEGAAQ